VVLCGGQGPSRGAGEEIACSKDDAGLSEQRARDKSEACRSGGIGRSAQVPEGRPNVGGAFGLQHNIRCEVQGGRERVTRKGCAEVGGHVHKGRRHGRRGG
jgi:hypothetical protein